ncbi:GatB/YqeY domain-containing protein [Curvivirga aplysinae]|uniref:GatB/YqeY domain-containing protein n=1 Tax=Curvivirga aplysinae TaxID=2529852 RepID=UPI002E264076|nr:GatB/YqeY domain-containing protein [Curvivirga aplysinae]
MMREQLNQALKDKMREKDSNAVSTLRLILAALKDRDIAARSKGEMDGIGDSDILQMLQTMVKQRRDSIQMYEQGGRAELAAKEQAEIDVIETFLPKQMNEDEMKEAISTLIEELGASSLKDMGNVMGAMRERFAGQMDFGKASGLVKTLLA